MKKDKIQEAYEQMLNEAKLSNEIHKAVDTFANTIRDKHGEPLSPAEVKTLKMVLNKEVDRLAADYKGM